MIPTWIIEGQCQLWKVLVNTFKHFSIQGKAILLFSLLWLPSLSGVKAQVSTSKAVDTLKSPDFIVYKQPAATPIWQVLATVLAPLLTAAGLGVAIRNSSTQTQDKRRDDRTARQLERLNKQLNELYGPLYITYAVGGFNLLAFRTQDGNFSFSNPNYLRWLNEIFAKTNNSLKKIINSHADLFVGSVPRHCLEFCHHVDTLNTCVAAMKDSSMSYELLDEQMNLALHPLDVMQAYVVAAFERLKDLQSQLLSAEPGQVIDVNEREIYNQIVEDSIKIFCQIKRDKTYKYTGVPEWAKDQRILADIMESEDCKKSPLAQD